MAGDLNESKSKNKLLVRTVVVHVDTRYEVESQL